MTHVNSQKTTKKKPIIGIVEPISIGKRAINVPTKIDTGADSSSIWASNIRVGRDGILRFSLFGEGSEYYNGKIYKRKDYSVSRIKSSTGHIQIRYSAKFTITVAGKKIRAKLNLSDRSKNYFKVLIGRRTISQKFLVDVSLGKSKLPEPTESHAIRKKLQKNPYKFHKKYVKPKTERKKQ